MNLSSAFRRLAAGARPPLPYRARLETLEYRCLPCISTNLLDSGPGSLRYHESLEGSAMLGGGGFGARSA